MTSEASRVSVGDGHQQEGADANLSPPQKERGSIGCVRRICVNLLLVLPIALGLLMYSGRTIHYELQSLWGYGLVRQYEGIPDTIMNMFRYYDVDNNGFIDPFEFLSLSDSFHTVKETADSFVFNDTELGPGSEVVTVKTYFEPVVLETMVKFQEYKQYLLGNPANLLPGLIAWKQAHLPEMSYGAKNFKHFLPLSCDHIPLGETYTLTSPLTLHEGSSQLHMNRYHPPTPTGSLEKFLFSLLSQFHPNVFLQNRFGPRGSVALVRARNNRFIDIMMRVHAEYELNTLPDFPFWFTPAQFSGRLIVNRDSSHVEYFELSLPTERSLNADMEWLTGENSNEVDIGYVPEMRLISMGPSKELDPSNNSTQGGEEKDANVDLLAIEWDKEISIDDAKKLLEQSMYPFKKIPYLRFPDAIDISQSANKLVHLILLWGALDDQSC